jgi:ATP synthase protein I
MMSDHEIRPDPAADSVPDNAIAEGDDSGTAAESEKVGPPNRSFARNPWADPPTYPRADPWQAVSYLISGVVVWGGIGWLAARWLGIPALIGLGFIIGGVLGILMTYLRYGRPQSGPLPALPADPPDAPRTPAPRPPDAPRSTGPSTSSSGPTAQEEEKP